MAKYYALVVFIFVLGFLFLWAIKFLFPKKKKQDDDAKDEKLLRLYRQIEDMMESFEEYVNEVKRELTSDREVFQDSLDKYELKINEKIKEFENSTSKEGTAKTSQAKKSKSSKNPPPKVEKLSKQEQVKQLYSEGMTQNDIAKKLNLTSGEIKLIIDVNN